MQQSSRRQQIERMKRQVPRYSKQHDHSKETPNPICWQPPFDQRTLPKMPVDFSNQPISDEGQQDHSQRVHSESLPQVPVQQGMHRAQRSAAGTIQTREIAKRAWRKNQGMCRIEEPQQHCPGRRQDDERHHPRVSARHHEKIAFTAGAGGQSFPPSPGCPKSRKHPAPVRTKSSTTFWRYPTQSSRRRYPRPAISHSPARHK